MDEIYLAGNDRGEIRLHLFRIGTIPPFLELPSIKSVVQHWASGGIKPHRH
jgi:hypothetical protein